MKSHKKVFVQIGFRFLTLMALIVFFSPAATAQTIQPAGVPERFTAVDGDILMPTEYVKSVLKQKALSPDAPQAVYTTNTWQIGTPPFQIRGVIPFEFDANVTAANQSLMISAMAVLEAAANVDFQQCASNVCIFSSTNFVHILNSNANSSSVGMRGGEQFITISNWTVQFKIVHELMHCLGFYHEQSRPDRNSFVQINCANIQGGCGGDIYNVNFQLLTAPIYGNYDFDSVMHYDQCGFSNDCDPGATCACTNPVMTVLAPNQNQQTLIGQRTHLSSLDRATVSFLYPYDDWTMFDCTYSGNNGTPNGTLIRPYTTLGAALADTPAGGTIWVLKNCTFPAGTYNPQVTIRAAPNVTATFGN
jgi:hypothetical protein